MTLFIKEKEKAIYEIHCFSYKSLSTAIDLLRQSRRAGRDRSTLSVTIAYNHGWQTMMH